LEIAEGKLELIAESMANLARNSTNLKSPKRRIKGDGSSVCSADHLMEAQSWRNVRRYLPEVDKLLGEETHNGMPLGKLIASIDGIDGSDRFIRGEQTWSNSIGIVTGGPEGRPIAGTAVQVKRAFLTRRGKGVKVLQGRHWKRFVRPDAAKHVIATDFGPTSPERYSGEVEKVSLQMQLPQEAMPAVHAGLEILTGGALCWWSYTAHHWDLAATALMLEETGCVAECLNGDPIPWDRVKMPPVILARSSRTADRVRKVLCS